MRGLSQELLTPLRIYPTLVIGWQFSYVFGLRFHALCISTNALLRTTSVAYWNAIMPPRPQIEIKQWC